MTRFRNSFLIARIAMLFSAGLVVAIMSIPQDAGAQSTVRGVPNAMQGFSQNRDQPIQIEAAALEVRDKQKEATFSGNVKVVQGDTTMTSKILIVYYDNKNASSGADKGQSKPKSTPAQTAAMTSATPGPTGSS